MVFCLMIISNFLFSQSYTIKGVRTDTLFIGMSNDLKVTGFDRDDKISIKTSDKIRSKKIGRHYFMLAVSRPFENDSIFILKNEEVIDCLTFSSIRTKLDQFIVTKNYGLLRSGSYPLEMLKDFKTVKVKINVPWIGDLPVKRYFIEIINKRGEIIIAKTIKKTGDLNDSEINAAIHQLKRGDQIRIRHIMVRTPYDDGERPKRFLFTVK